MQFGEPLEKGSASASGKFLPIIPQLPNESRKENQSQKNAKKFKKSLDIPRDRGTIIQRTRSKHSDSAPAPLRPSNLAAMFGSIYENMWKLQDEHGQRPGRKQAKHSPPHSHRCEPKEPRIENCASRIDNIGKKLLRAEFRRQTQGTRSRVPDETGGSVCL